MARGKVIIGVDLGGTNINVGMLTADNRVDPKSQVNKKTQAAQGVDVVISRIADAIKESCEQAGITTRQVAAVGIGAAGAIDPVRGVVRKGPNLGFTNVPLAAAIQKKVGARTFLENDVNAAAYGEWKMGAAKGVTDFMAVWIGTGVGGGIVLNNKMYSGGFLTAGEIGHMMMVPGAPMGRRSVEDTCSRTAISERLLALMSTGHPSMLKEIIEKEKKELLRKTEDDLKRKGKASWQFESNKILRSRAIAEAYKAGDDLTRAVVHEAAEYLGMAIGGVVTLLSLPHVVIGGGFTEALGEPWVRAVREEVRKYAFPGECKKVEVKGTALKDTAGIVGAGLLARDGMGKR